MDGILQPLDRVAYDAYASYGGAVALGEEQHGVGPRSGGSWRKPMAGKTFRWGVASVLVSGVLLVTGAGGHQRTGYWKPDGDGIEVVAPKEWAAALDLLAGGREDAFVTSARALLGRGDHVLAFRLVTLGLINHPASSTLADLRRRALDGLRARHQQLNPFKFIIYSEWAGADLRPAE